MTADTFTGTPGTALPTHSANWQAQSGDWEIGAGGTACSVHADSTEQEVCVIWTGHPSGARAAMRTKVTIASGSSGNWMGPGVRHVAGQHTRYGCYINPFNGLAEINKVVSGEFTTLASAGEAIEFVDGDVLELEIDGSGVMTAYLNGTPITGLTGITDPGSSIATGLQGMIGYAFDSGDLIDEFDDLAPAGALPPKSRVRPVAPPPPTSLGRLSRREAPAPQAGGYVVERRRARSEPPLPRLVRGRTTERDAPVADAQGRQIDPQRRTRGPAPAPLLRGRTTRRDQAPAPAAGTALPLLRRAVQQVATESLLGRTSRRSSRPGAAEIGTATSCWNTPSGFRFGLGDQTSLSVDLEVEAHPDEGQLVGVTFHVSVNGGAATNVPTTLSDRRPNFTDQPSPLPGSGGLMSKSLCCGFDLDLGALAGGTIEISATIRSNDGTSNYDTSVAAITVYNDIDGVDRRPCDGVRYVSPSGSDSNDGLSTSTPKLRLGAAVDSLITEFGADLRGGRVVMMAGAHAIGGDTSVASWHTSGAGWLDVEFDEGATIARTLDGSGETVYPNSYFRLTGNGAGTHCRVRWIASHIVGDGIVGLVSANVLPTFLFLGGSQRSSWSTGSNLLAKFRDDGGEPCSWDGAGSANGRYAAVCHWKRGGQDGYVSYSYVRDCYVEHWFGIAFYLTSLTGTGSPDWRSGAGHTVNCQSADQDYVYDDGTESGVLGVIDYSGGTNLVFSAQSGGAHDGKMRITCSSAPAYDIFAHAASLVGGRKVGMMVTGATSGGNNVSVPVLEAGSGYMILDATPTPETGAAATRLRTAARNTIGGAFDTWANRVHPDIWRIQGDHTGAIVSGLATDTTVRSTQGLFSAGYTMTRCVLREITIPENCRNNFDDSDLVDCVLRHMTLAADTGFNSSSLAGTKVHDVVFGTQGGLGSAGAALVNRCHVISGGGVGTNSTTGAWFEDYPAQAYRPATGVRGNDSGAFARSALAKWLDDAAWSQGAGEYGAGALTWAEVPQAERVPRLRRETRPSAPAQLLLGRTSRRQAAGDAEAPADAGVQPRRAARSPSPSLALLGRTSRRHAAGDVEAPAPGAPLSRRVLPVAATPAAMRGRAARRGGRPGTAGAGVIAPTINLIGTRDRVFDLVGTRDRNLDLIGTRDRNVSIEGTTT